MPVADSEAEEISRISSAPSGNFSWTRSAYQYTPYFAAMRRALCSSVSRRTAFVDFAGLDSVVLVSVVLVSDLGSVVVAVVVVAAGAWVWAGAVVSVGAVAAWASCIETWAIGFAGSVTATPARLRPRDSPAWAEADASSRTEMRINLRM